MSFLLESVEGGAVRGRYSIIGLEPDLIWRTIGDARRDQPRRARPTPDAFAPCHEPPLAALRALIAESRIALPDGAAADGGRHLRLSRLRHGAADGGIAAAQSRSDRHSRCDPGAARPSCVVFDAVKDTITVVTPVRPETGVSAKAALARAGRAARRHRRRARPAARPCGRRRRRRPARRAAALQHHAGRIRAHGARAPRSTSPPATSSRSCWRSASRRRSTLPPFALYRALRRVNPSPYLYFLDFGDFAVAGSSPEILVKVAGGTVTIRPIAGTRPRGATPHEDKALEVELLADPKERAEHLMLLDLGRNDVGRVAEIGTVKVTDQFFIERYSQVMHIVSNVEGALADDARRARCAGGRLSRRHRLGRAEGARDGDHRRAGEGEARRSMPAASAISPPPARWTPASCCAPRWSRTA